MTSDEFRRLLPLVFGGHGAQTRAAEFFGVSDRTVRRWVSGASPVPEYVAATIILMAPSFKWNCDE